MDIDELKGIVENEIANAEYYTSIDDHSIAMDYYLALPRGDEIVGRSDVQSHDVADMIEALTAQIMPTYANADLVKFDALNPEDEIQVDEESKMVNHAVMNQNNGYILIQSLLKDALMFRNAIAKVDVRTNVKVRTVQYEDELNEFDTFAIEQELGPNEELVVTDTNVISIIKTTKKLVVEAVPPEEFIFSSGWDEVSLTNCPFTAHHRTLLRYMLIEMGYDPVVVNGLSASTSIFPNNENVRDNDADDYTENPTNFDSDPIDYYECYVVLDFNEDGYSEIRKVCLAGDTLIHNEEIDYHPFAGGTAILLPHRFRGISTYDQQKDVQDAKTKILRQYVDNINQLNNRRLEVEVKNIIDMNDVLDSKPAGVVKVKKIGSVVPIPVDNIGPSCTMFLEYWDKIRTNRSGASLDMVSENLPVGGDTAHGAERVISSKEQIAALASTTFKESTIREMFLLVHKTMRLEFGGEKLFHVQGNWIKTDPGKWMEREGVIINVGLSQGESIKKMQAIGSIIGQQTQAFDKGQGNILVTNKNVYNSLTDYARVAGIENPRRYWNDPDNEIAKNTMDTNSKEGEKQQQLQEQLQISIMKNESLRTQSQDQAAKSKSMLENLKFQLEQAKTAASAAETDANLKFDYMKHYDELAMQLTNLEAQYNDQVNDYKENKNQVL